MKAFKKEARLVKRAEKYCKLVEQEDYIPNETETKAFLKTAGAFLFGFDLFAGLYLSIWTRLKRLQQMGFEHPEHGKIIALEPMPTLVFVRYRFCRPNGTTGSRSIILRRENPIRPPEPIDIGSLSDTCRMFSYDTVREIARGIRDNHSSIHRATQHELYEKNLFAAHVLPMMGLETGQSLRRTDAMDRRPVTDMDAVLDAVENPGQIPTPEQLHALWLLGPDAVVSSIARRLERFQMSGEALVGRPPGTIAYYYKGSSPFQVRMEHKTFTVPGLGDDADIGLRLEEFAYRKAALEFLKGTDLAPTNVNDSSIGRFVRSPLYDRNLLGLILDDVPETHNNPIAARYKRNQAREHAMSRRPDAEAPASSKARYDESKGSDDEGDIV